MGSKQYHYNYITITHRHTIKNCSKMLDANVTVGHKDNQLYVIPLFVT